MASPTPDPLPMGLGIEIDRAVRLTDEGHVLVGGSPPRALRLSPESVSTVIRWLSGARPDHHRERVLARALVESGLAHPRPTPEPPGDGVQIALVGPASPGELAATLDILAAQHPHLHPIVAGVAAPAASVARGRGLRVLSGPAAGAQARTAALRACDSEFVALMRAGTQPGTGWLDIALGHFADPGVAAVVPRVLAARQHCGPVGMTVAALAALHADRGADPAPILPWGHGHHGPGQPAPPNGHLCAEPLEPFSVLVVRRGLADLDPCLGEAAEVELLWRLADEGWSVRYEPRSRLRAPMPTGVGSYLRSRFEAGAASAPLARRRGQRAAGPELSLPAAAALALAVAGRPATGLAVGAAGAAATARELVRGAGTPVTEAVRPAVADLVHTARTGARVARTTWWPLVAAVAVGGAAAQVRRARRTGVPAGFKGLPGAGGLPSDTGRWALAAGAVLTLPHLASWQRRRGTAVAGPVAWTGLAAAGDAARSLGTWWGMAKAGSLAPLVPRGHPPVSAVSPVPNEAGSGTGEPVRGSGAKKAVILT